MRAAISLPMTDTIPEPCSTISATRTSSTPSAAPSFRPTGSATSGEISVDWRPSPAPRVAAGTVRRVSNELGCACGRCDPRVGRGDFWILKIAHAPSHKNLSKNGFCPRVRGGLSVEGVFAKKFSGPGADSAALTTCLAKLAIDANRFLVQHLRFLGLASEQPGGRERAEAASEGLGGATGTHQGVGLTQEALALFDVIRPQPRRPSPQKGTSLMKPVTEFAVQSCSAHGLVVIGGVFKFSDLACLPGEKPGSHCCRRLLVELGERFINPAPVLQH